MLEAKFWETFFRSGNRDSNGNIRIVGLDGNSSDGNSFHLYHYLACEVNVISPLLWLPRVGKSNVSR